MTFDIFPEASYVLTCCKSKNRVLDHDSVIHGANCCFCDASSNQPFFRWYFEFVSHSILFTPGWGGWNLMARLDAIDLVLCIGNSSKKNCRNWDWFVVDKKMMIRRTRAYIITIKNMGRRFPCRLNPSVRFGLRYYIHVQDAYWPSIGGSSSVWTSYFLQVNWWQWQVVLSGVGYRLSV